MTNKIIAVLQNNGFDFGAFNEAIIPALYEAGELENVIDDLEFDESDNTVTFEGDEFKVLTDEEADEEFYQYEMSLIEDVGIECFSKNFRQTILDNYITSEWFEQAMQESFEFYCYDIENETASDDEFENRLQEEMSEWEVENIDDMVEKMCEDQGDAKEWYIFNFGGESFNHVVQENSLVDWDAVIEEVKNLDGRGNCLASYDGEEREEEVDCEIYYIYQTN